MAWNKNIHIDQWNRTEDTDTSSDIFNYLIFNKGVKGMCWRKDSLFNKVLRKLVIYCPAT